MAARWLEPACTDPLLNLNRNGKWNRWRCRKPGVQFASFHFEWNGFIGATVRNPARWGTCYVPELEGRGNETEVKLLRCTATC